LKSQQQSSILKIVEPETPFILQNLKKAIEQNYRTKHSASEYAGILNISPNSLTRLAKVHLGKTLTDVIAERIIVEAKRELYLTSNSIKQIAFDLGYTDEFYFSRFFKTNTGISPQVYRSTVGFARA
jgi:AraC-like DNA-binding protein